MGGTDEIGEYLGNVNLYPGSYYELVRIQAKSYHKNTSAWLKGIADGINSLLGGDPDYFVQKKVFSV